MTSASGSSGSIDVERSCAVCAQSDSAPYAIARDVEYFTSDAEYQYRRCRACGAVWLPNPPVNELHRIYPANYYSFQPVKRSLAGYVKDLLDKHLFRWCLRQMSGAKLCILDVGGGAGYQLDIIRGLDSRVTTTTVVDLDANAEAIAVEQGHGYFHGRIEDFRPSVKYDLVLAINLIEHVANPAEVLAKLRACLSDDGMILIKTPNIDSWDARLFRHRNWGGYHCPRHWVLFDKESFESLAFKTGLVPIRFSYTQGAPFWSISCLAALNRRGWIQIGSARPAYTHPLYKLSIIVFAALDILRAPLARPSQMFFVLRSRNCSRKERGV